MNAALGAAFVTGGSSGIGLAIARALHERGHPVAICGRDRRKLDRAARELGTDGLFAAPADVSRREDVERWLDDGTAAIGPPRLLVLNAGLAHYGEIASFPDDAWDETIAVNLTGPFLVARAALPRMREAGGGYVFSISSVSGKKGMPGAGAYCASKFGVVGLTESLLREEAPHGIRATAICPGLVATPMAGGGNPSEMIQPEDIARTVLWLLDLSPQVVVREVVVERTGAL